MTIEEQIVSLLARSPADQYSIYRQIGDASLAQVTKAVAALQKKKLIHIANYRKSRRTGIDVPIYSLASGGADKLDVHSLLAGVTSERLIEYDFVARNLAKRAAVLDIGSAGSELVRLVRKFNKGRFVIGIDIAGGCDAKMDARSAGLRSSAFDQVISISTIEHIGVPGDPEGDAKAMKEILRVLKKGGSAIISVPYGKIEKAEHRVYDGRGLDRLAKGFAVATKEFYCYKNGKWKKCSQKVADVVADAHAPLHLHSVVCACLLLKKQ